MAADFSAIVQRSYALEGQHVLLLEGGYEGDIGQGEWIELAEPAASEVSGSSGEPEAKRRARVASLAWGSAFHATEPPLTLIVEGLAGDPPGPGTRVRGVTA
jgi:hypothetical protein